MSYSNGANHQNVEQLLASIRSQISDNHPLAVNGSSAVRKEISRPEPETDDFGEFELPAIFRPDRPAARPNGTRLGRLSEALSNVTAPKKAPQTDQPDSTVIHLTPPAGRMAQPQPSAPASEPPQRLSSDDDDADWHAATDRATSSNTGCQRKMASFCDTRFSRMGAMGEKPKVEEQPAPTAAPANSAPESKARETPPVAPNPAPAATTHHTQHEVGHYSNDLQLPMPPPLPMAGAAEGGAEQHMDDVAAQMLRPILRQWLTDNMPKIVEKALRSEAAMGNPQQPAPAVNHAATTDGRETE